ncbi:MAG: hypothetical protein IT436_06055 [Phycisphaerales bacterium]|nr:hypothetical protein [Phycisphaerales bacterium]
MKSLWTVRALAAVLAAAFIFAGPARAASVMPLMASDKITLKDGRVLEGTVTRELQGYVWFKVSVGGIEQEFTFGPDEVVKLERDAQSTPKPEDAKPADNANPGAEARKSGVPRLAILTLQGMVGMEMAAKPLEDAIDDLKKEGVTDVILKVNSGGGFLLEIQRISDVIHNKYKKEFRTVGWIESAISAAAMSSHCLEEIYFLPNGNYGACTGWSGALTAVKGRELEGVLLMMEKISARGNHPKEIMRAMQISADAQELSTLGIAPPSGALSASIDPDGDVHWYQDSTSGQFVLNPKGEIKILTFNANEAERFKFSRGTAATKDDLARLMGYTEVEWVGKQKPGYLWPVSKAEERQIKWREEVTDANTRFGQYVTQYQTAIANALASQDKQGRGSFVNRARQALDILRQIARKHPNFVFLYNLTPEWFQEQEEFLRKLMQ